MDQSWPPPPAATLAALVAVLVLAGAGTLLLSTVPSGAVETDATPQKLVEPKPGDNVFWPYTSKRTSATGRTLAINVVVYGDAQAVRYFLSQGRDASWNETEAQWQDVDPDAGDADRVDSMNGSVVEWAAARGAKRYLYVHDLALTEERPNSTARRPYQAAPYTMTRGENPGGRWIEESYQLHDGRYFGSRDHLRVYESPFESDDWVAIQAHSDHWDWFRLRHTVHGTEGAQNRVEAEFMSRSFVDAVWRMHLDNPKGVGSDGWATVVDLYGYVDSPGAGGVGAAVTGLALVGGIRRARGGRTSRARGGWIRRARGGRTRRAREGSGGPFGVRRRRIQSALRSWDRLERRHAQVVRRGLSYALLFASLFVLYLSIRFGGIFLETRFDETSPKVIAAALYPVLAFGLPLAAHAFGRDRDPVRSFAAATLGIGTAIVVDYQFLAVTVLPLDVVLHRLGITIALGFIAAGAVSREAPAESVNRLVGAGVLVWVYLLLAPLVGWL